MKIDWITVATVAALFLTMACGTGQCGTASPYDETVSLIRATMTGNTSVARQESYGHISFDNCRMEYQVSGVYPVGGPYTITFSGIDFSTLNPAAVERGHDYTAFVMLRFDKSIKFKDEFKELAVKTLVVNMFDDEAAERLLNAFLRLGDLCSSTSNWLVPPRVEP
jgi:hypothetical protein